MTLNANIKQPVEYNPFEPCVSDNDLSLDALGAGALEKNQFFFRAGAGDRSLIYATDPRFISKLHRVVKLLVGNDSPLFKVVLARGGYFSVEAEPLGVALADIFQADFDQIRRDYPMHRFSPYFEVLENTRFNFGHDVLKDRYTRARADRVVKSLDKRVKAIRRRLRYIEVVNGYSNFRRSPVENFNGLMDGMQRVIDADAKQLILRLDCYFRVSDLDLSEKDIQADIEKLPRVQKCRERFHRSIDRKFGASLRGFAFCLEYGQHRRWHYHYLLFVDPSYRDDDVELVEELREIWDKVTGGQGESHNVNEQKTKRRFRAIGFVDARDERVLVGLRTIASYFTLAGLYVQLKLPRRVKTFGKGRFPVPQPKPGRPPKRTTPRLRISLAEARERIRFI